MRCRPYLGCLDSISMPPARYFVRGANRIMQTTEQLCFFFGRQMHAPHQFPCAASNEMFLFAGRQTGRLPCVRCFTNSLPLKNSVSLEEIPTSNNMNNTENDLAQTIDWEETHRAVRHFEVRMDNIVPLQNNRLTTEWNCLLLAKSIIEDGGWLQTDPFRFKLRTLNDWERYLEILCYSHSFFGRHSIFCSTFKYILPVGTRRH